MIHREINKGICVKAKGDKTISMYGSTMRGFQVIPLLLYPALITLLPWLMDADQDTGIISFLIAQQQCPAVNS